MKIGVVTSGGDAPGMNAVIRAVVRSSIYYGVEIYGIRDGYRGLLEKNIFKMDESSVGDIIHKGGTILGTARCDEFKKIEGQKKAANILKSKGISNLIVLGGDGSLKGGLNLSNFDINVMGIPCTIDNDLEYTDYSIGFWTAVETAIDLIGKLRDTSSSHGRANIIEVMGRGVGDIGLYSALAGGGESLIVPEKPVDKEYIISKIKRGRMRGKRHNLIVVTENVTDVYQLAENIKDETGIDTRVTVLGHVQRGGNPVAIDRVMASLMGEKAVELILDGERNRALGIVDNKYISIDINKALEEESTFNEEIYKAIDILSI